MAISQILGKGREDIPSLMSQSLKHHPPLAGSHSTKGLAPSSLQGLGHDGGSFLWEGLAGSEVEGKGQGSGERR